MKPALVRAGGIFRAGLKPAPTGRKSTMDATPPTTHRHVIEPHRGWMAVGWRELWRFRELLWLLTWRDVKVRYKQTVLGFLWAVVQPLMKMIVLTMIFRGVTGIDVSDGHPYAVVLFAGLLPWQRRR